MDATVLFIDALVEELRKRGWKFISIQEAFQDKLYESKPLNTYTGNGLIAQLAYEKSGVKVGDYKFEAFKNELNKVLKLDQP